MHVFGTKTLGNGGRVRQVTKEYGDLFPFAFERTPGCQNFLGKVFRSIGQGFACWVWGWSRGEYWGFRDWGRRRGYCLLTNPHKTSILVVSHWMHVEEFILQIVEVVVIEVKASLEGTIGYPSLACEEVDDLGEHLIKGHSRPFHCLDCRFDTA